MEEPKMHIKKPLIIFVGLLLTSTTIVGAYISVNGISLPDVPVTMNVADGTTSYFVITLSNVPAGSDITNGVYPGWCAEFGPHMTRNTDLTVTLYDSYDPNLPARAHHGDSDWAKVNWVLNNKGSNGMMDIEYAIWYLLEEIPYSYLPPNAQTLVANAVPFTPQAGNIIAIIAVPQEGNQVGIIEYVIPGNYGGLTPGYWKNHLTAWHTYSPTQTVGSVFTVPSSLSALSGDTLLTALQYNGGKNDIGAARILLRSAVGALLNAADPQINYPLTTSAIIQQVNVALTQGRTAMLNLEQVLDDYNNLGE